MHYKKMRLERSTHASVGDADALLIATGINIKKSDGSEDRKIGKHARIDSSMSDRALLTVNHLEPRIQIGNRRRNIARDVDKIIRPCK